MVSSVKQPAAVRRRRILELMNEGDFLRPADIAAAMSVSGETIRRDLMALEQSGELRRIHGGAVAPVRVIDTEPDRANRSMEHPREKEEIAAAVASLVSDDDTVFMDVGTTVEAAARGLPSSFCGIVITNSLVVGSMLGDRPSIELYVLGGRMRVGELTTYGPEVLSQVRSFNADLAFLGAGGIDVAAGFTDYSTEDVATKQMMIEKASKTYVLAVGEKLGRVAVRHVCDLGSISGVITNRGANSLQVANLRKAGVQVLLGGTGQ
jgi:DeoR family fructose operon transcriptional repressor